MSENETTEQEAPQPAGASSATTALSARDAARRRNRRKLMWQIPLLVVMSVVVVWTFGALFGRHLFLYHPTRLGESELLEIASAQPGWTLDTTSLGETRTSVGLMRPADAGEPWVMYFGGNAQDLGSSRSVLDQLVAERPWGAAVWAYRGYDGTPGTPTESHLVDDGVELARSLMRRHGVAPQRLVLVGQSLGSGVATQVAKRLAEEDGTPVAGLVLISPYRSIPAVGNDHFFWPLGHAMPDKYDNMRHLPGTVAPVLIVHGTEDGVIPFRHGKALHEAITPRSTFVELDGVGHNDVWSQPQSATEVRGFIERVTAADAAD